MVKKIRAYFNLDYESDFSFNIGISEKICLLLIALMMYLVTISVSSSFIANSIINKSSGTESFGKLTIEFSGNGDDISGILTDKQKTSVMNILSTTDGVKNVKNLSDKDMKNMLEKCMPGIEMPDEMPLPTLFEAELSNDVNLPLLSNQLAKVNKNVRVYDHSTINSPAIKINLMFKTASIFLSILAILMLCAAVYYLMNNSVIHNINTIRVLRTIGASNKYISTQFRKLNFGLGAKASVISVIISSVTFFILYNSLSLHWFHKYFFICALIIALIPIIMSSIIMVISNMIVGSAIDKKTCGIDEFFG